MGGVVVRLIAAAAMIRSSTHDFTCAAGAGRSVVGSSRAAALGAVVVDAIPATVVIASTGLDLSATASVCRPVVSTRAATSLGSRVVGLVATAIVVQSTRSHVPNAAFLCAVIICLGSTATVELEESTRLDLALTAACILIVVGFVPTASEVIPPSKLYVAITTGLVSVAVSLTPAASPVRSAFLDLAFTADTFHGVVRLVAAALVIDPP